MGFLLMLRLRNEPGLYLHIPFCEQRCYYCAFTVAVSPELTFGAYVDRLVREIALSGFERDPATVYFGEERRRSSMRN
jgi:oxygen-independent coproporphyrinogen-3 oxidase